MAYQGIDPVRMDSVSITTTSPQVDVGTRAVVDGFEYVYVYNAGQWPLYPGKSCYLLSLTSGYSVTATNAAAQVGHFAGGIHHTTMATAYYGYIMTRGVCRVSPDTNESSFDAGDYIAVGVNEGYVTLTGAGATLSTANRIGLCISSGVTHEGASLASCGKAWIKSDVF